MCPLFFCFHQFILLRADNCKLKVSESLFLVALTTASCCSFSSNSWSEICVCASVTLSCLYSHKLILLIAVAPSLMFVCPCSYRLIPLPHLLLLTAVRPDMQNLHTPSSVLFSFLHSFLARSAYHRWLFPHFGVCGVCPCLLAAFIAGSFPISVSVVCAHASSCFHRWLFLPYRDCGVCPCLCLLSPLALSPFQCLWCVPMPLPAFTAGSFPISVSVVCAHASACFHRWLFLPYRVCGVCPCLCLLSPLALSPFQCLWCVPMPLGCFHRWLFPHFSVCGVCPCLCLLSPLALFPFQCLWCVPMPLPAFTTGSFPISVSVVCAHVSSCFHRWLFLPYCVCSVCPCLWLLPPLAFALL